MCLTRIKFWALVMINAWLMMSLAQAGRITYRDMGIFEDDLQASFACREHRFLEEGEKTRRYCYRYDWMLPDCGHPLSEKLAGVFVWQKQEIPGITGDSEIFCFMYSTKK